MKETVENFILINMIGKFSLGEIYFSKKKGTEEIFAIKKIGRNYIDKQGLSKIIDKEIELSQSLVHPNICRYFGILKTENYYYLVMEYINGLALSQCLEMYQHKYNASFSEQIVQYLMKQIIDAFKLIHSKNIIHRDINLDNIMVHFNDENDKNNLNLLKANIKIIDFGLAINGDSDKTVLGSPLTMSPELLRSLVNLNNNKIAYDNKIDIWSLGAVCYEMLTGKTVYDAQSLDDLVKKAEIGTYKIPNNLSMESNSFLYNMLRYTPNQRLSADILAMHSFLTKNIAQIQRLNQTGEIVLNTKEEKPELKFGNQATQLFSKNNYANSLNNINNLNNNNYSNPLNNYGYGPNNNNIYYKNNYPINSQFLANYGTNLGAINQKQNVNIPQKIVYPPSQTNNNVINLGTTSQIQNGNKGQQIVYPPSQTNNNVINLGTTSQIQNGNKEQQIANQNFQSNDDNTKKNNFLNATQNNQGNLNQEKSQISMENNNNSQKVEQEQEMNEGKNEDNKGKQKLKRKSAEEKGKENEKNEDEGLCKIF